jgi:hypothetical protein
MNITSVVRTSLAVTVVLSTALTVGCGSDRMIENQAEDAPEQARQASALYGSSEPDEAFQLGNDGSSTTAESGPPVTRYAQKPAGFFTVTAKEPPPSTPVQQWMVERAFLPKSRLLRGLTPLCA